MWRCMEQIQMVVLLFRYSSFKSFVVLPTATSDVSYTEILSLRIYSLVNKVISNWPTSVSARCPFLHHILLLHLLCLFLLPLSSCTSISFCSSSNSYISFNTYSYRLSLPPVLPPPPDPFTHPVLPPYHLSPYFHHLWEACKWPGTCIHRYTSKSPTISLFLKHLSSSFLSPSFPPFVFLLIHCI